MHELGVVFHVIKSLNSIAKEQNIDKICRVTLQIGEVSTAIPSQITDCWNWAVKKETVLRDCPLVIERIPAVTKCNACGKTYETVKYGKICPHCESPDTYLLQGNEFIIKDIAVSEQT